ncbi:FprA family A-type flavoprotein [Thermoproteota archaeon]
MKPVEISKNIYWVGGIDWNLRNFHGYLTQRGSTYNAYLIIDEKITLIDTVKHYLVDEMLARISTIIDPCKIDYIISNHVEMDHSGGLPTMLEKAPGAKLVTSAPNGEKGLRAHYKQDWPFITVKSGDTLNIGKRTLSFVATPMVHWPDNMVTYSPYDKVLFSNDAFGQHIASFERLDTQYTLEIMLEEAKKYYANIVLPYSSQVCKALDAVKGLDIQIIAPSHGLIWTTYIPEILDRYSRWSSNTTLNKALIIYDTMWGSTEKIAIALYNAFEEKDISVQLMNLQTTHISDIMTQIMDSKYICVGSPTLNNNIMPAVSAFLTYMKGLSPKNRVGIAFGSYGWGGQSVGQVHESLKECGFDLMEPIKVNYLPSDEDLRSIQEKVGQFIA